MKKIIILSLMISLSFITIVSAKRLSKPQLKDLKQRPELREQMEKMILSVFDMDIMMHRTKVVNYEILTEDAERILQAIKNIKTQDSSGLFYKHLKILKEPTSQLLKYAKIHDQRALKYREQIFNACFQCHSVYRNNPLYSNQE